MKRLHLKESWPETWKYAYPYDLQEIWGEISRWGYFYAYENRRKRTLRLLNEVLPAGAKVLDVAAAQGNFSIALAEAGYEVTWNDLREDLAEYVERKRELGSIAYAPGDVFSLGFSEEFDCVLVTEIIEHVSHPDQFLKTVAQMVKPGGYVIMTTPNGAYLRNQLPKFSECPDPEKFESIQFGPNAEDHIFLLWPEEIPWLAEQAGLILEKDELFTNPLTAGHMKLERVLKVVPRLFVSAFETFSQALPGTLKKRVLIQSVSRFRKPAENNFSPNSGTFSSPPPCH